MNKKVSRIATAEKNAIETASNEVLNQQNPIVEAETPKNGDDAIMETEAQKAVDELLADSSVMVAMKVHERIKIVDEISNKARQLERLKSALDELQSWGFGDSGKKAVITIEGDSSFSTTNTEIISRCKAFLCEQFEERIKLLNAEILAAKF
jgi:hypothetical protein